MNRQVQSWNLDKVSFVTANGMEQDALKSYGYLISGENANLVSAKYVVLIARHLITDYSNTLSYSKMAYHVNQSWL